VAVKIKLKRLGKIRTPQYRIVIADSRTKRDGRAIEEIGKYHPKEDPSYIEVDSERIQYWLGVGAQPTESVASILKVTGDWQKFKGLPAPPPMKVAEAKANKRALFEVAAKEAAAEPKAATTSAKKRAEKPADKPEKVEKAAEAAVVEAPVAEAPAAEAPVVEAPVVDATAPAAPAEA
jgi:small subunit ribosomal protein S16